MGGSIFGPSEFGAIRRKGNVARNGRRKGQRGCSRKGCAIMADGIDGDATGLFGVIDPGGNIFGDIEKAFVGREGEVDGVHGVFHCRDLAKSACLSIKIKSAKAVAEACAVRTNKKKHRIPRDG